MYNGVAGNRVTSIGKDEEPAVIKNLENAQRQLADAQLAYQQLDFAGGKTGGRVSRSDAISAAGNLTSARGNLDRALADHMAYFDPEAQKQRRLQKLGVSGFRNMGKLPQGIVTPILSSQYGGGSSGGNIPSRSDTFNRFLSSVGPNPEATAGTRTGAKQPTTEIQNVAQNTSRSNSLQSKMIGLLEQIRNCVCDLGYLPNPNQAPAPKLPPGITDLPMNPDVPNTAYSGKIPNFKQLGIAKEEAELSKISGYKKNAKGIMRTDLFSGRKIPTFVNGEEIVIPQKDLAEVLPGADGPLVLAPNTTNAGRKNRQELKQKLSKVPNFISIDKSGRPMPLSGRELDEFRDRLRNLPTRANPGNRGRPGQPIPRPMPPTGKVPPPGHVNIGGKFHKVDLLNV